MPLSPDAFKFGFDAPQLDPKYFPLNLDALGLTGGAHAWQDGIASVASVASGVAGVASGAPHSVSAENANGGNFISSAIAGAVGNVEAWFIRGTVVILGFIFIAIGLSMFRNPIINPPPLVKP